MSLDWEGLHEMGSREHNRADAHDQKAAEHRAAIGKLERMHPGTTAKEFRADEAKRLEHEAFKEETQAKICRRRSAMAHGQTVPGKFFFPAGPDEHSDHEFMGENQRLYGEFSSKGLTRSTGETLRGNVPHWGEPTHSSGGFAWQ
jgi:hypothetical protein